MNKKPYSWVPTLYLSESLPFSAVMLVSVIMFKEYGLNDTQITLYTGWLGLPWVVKPLWSPVVDGVRTKRWWILVTQFFMGAGLALVAFTLSAPFWLQSSLALFMLIAFASSTHDISADGFYILGLSDRDQELYVGVRNTFYRIGMVIGQGGLVVLVGKMQEGLFGETFASVATSWALAFIVLGVVMMLLAGYHSVMLPRVEGADYRSLASAGKDEGRAGGNTAAPVEDGRGILTDFYLTIKSFATRPHVISALCFILLFRLPEGLLTKIVPLFLTRSTTEGGLALSDVDFGLIYGTLGVIGLLLGGIVGGWAVSRWGLKRCLWPLVLCITLPDVVYVYLSYVPTGNLWLVGSCVCIEQIGYGLGFAAYTLFLVTFSRGDRSTSVFSICTAGQYLGGVMLPGMVSGLISDTLGYQQFFLLIMLLCLVTFAVTALVKVEAYRS